MIFAEGGVSNGKNVSKFKRGAFVTLKPVKPMVMKYHWNNVQPDAMSETLPLIFSEWGLKSLTVTHLPTFAPNDYFYAEYAKTIDGHEKMEKWEIYAHAVNEIIREEGGLGVNTQPTRCKLEYFKFIAGKTNEIEVNGKKFYYPHRAEITTSEEKKTE